ncbi:Protein transport protein YIP1 [Cucumispora dikerogammari]|nr:Protein transport protein YIP1 [Cucumispora dikerogammari]
MSNNDNGNYNNDDSNNKRRIIKMILTGTLPNEESILKELGVDLINILEGSKLIFNLFSKTPLRHTSTQNFTETAEHDFIESPDLIGPVVLLIIYTAILVLQGKLHFGYIYVLSVSSVLLMYFLFNVISEKTVSIIQVGSIMGYSFGPIIFYSLLNYFLPRKVRVLVSLCFSFWSALTSTLVLSEYLAVKDKKMLFLYPMVIMYFAFCCLVLF